jgi:phage tail sheath protein FI
VRAPKLGSDDTGLDKADIVGSESGKTGFFALEKADLFNLLVIPPYAAGDVDPTLWPVAAAYCERRRAMLLIDPPSAWTSKDAAKSGISTSPGAASFTSSKNAAIYFPRIVRPNPFHDNMLESFAPSGAVAGVISRIDATRGVWKAPAGLEATLNGVVDLSVRLTDLENGELNPLGVNCLRIRPAAGPAVWGARTRQGDDRLASEWKYVPVRRLALYLEESLYRGLQWVIFEPNDEPLWSQIRLNVGGFLQTLFRQGAFLGSTPQQAYFVKCDRETTTQSDIDRGIVNVVVGFAPLKPAEFVILKIQQIAGQILT